MANEVYRLMRVPRIDTIKISTRKVELFIFTLSKTLIYHLRIIVIDTMSFLSQLQNRAAQVSGVHANNPLLRKLFNSILRYLMLTSISRRNHRTARDLRYPTRRRKPSCEGRQRGCVGL